MRSSSMSKVLVAAGYQGAIKGAQEPPINIVYSLLMGQAKQWLCELLTLCSPKGEGATSREQEQGDLLPAPLALPKGLGQAIAFLCASVSPLSVIGG